MTDSRAFNFLKSTWLVKFLVSLLTVSTALCTLQGCQQRHVGADRIEVAAPSIQRIRAGYRQVFAKTGIQIFRSGEDQQILIPADVVFKAGSSNLRRQEELLLASVARYLSTYKTLYIRVRVFTDNTAPLSIRQALSDKRAQRVANLLWANGVDSRIISAHGAGVQPQASSNKYPSGRMHNRRIEIVFRHIADTYPE